MDVYLYPETNYKGAKAKLLEQSGGFPFSPKSIELFWKPYGIYLCEDAGMKECAVYEDSSASLSENIDNKIGYIYFKQPAGIKYIIVLHEDQNFQGKCTVYTSGENGEKALAGGDLPDNEASSIHIFFQPNESLGEGVTLYEVEDYNKDCGEQCYKTCPQSPCGDDCAGFFGGPGHCWGSFKATVPNFDSGHNVMSVKIDGRYLAALFTSFGKCEVFTGNDPFLKDNYIGKTHIKGLIILPIK